MVARGIKKAGFVFFLVFSLLFRHAPAQESGSAFLLPGVSQASFFNPALQSNPGKLVVGIPLLSGIHGSGRLNVPLNAFFTEGFHYSFDRFYNALGDRGEGDVSATVSMFYARLKVNDYHFSLSLSERFFSTAGFDREIIKLIRDGVEPFYGASERFGSAGFHLQQYRELALGISTTSGEVLDFGIRPKILFGKLFFETRDLQFSVETDTENNLLLLQPEGSYTFSGPFHQTVPGAGLAGFTRRVLPGDYFFQLRNLGLALDLGAVFRPSEPWEFSVSLLDAGFAGFKHNTFDVAFSGASVFNGENLYQSHSPGEDNYLESLQALRAFADSASYIIDVFESRERKLVPLPFHLSASGKYHFSKRWSAGVHHSFTLFEQKTWNVLSAFVQAVPHKKVHLAGSLSVIDFSSLRPGGGISYTPGNFEFFFASDNILGILQPSASKHLNLHAGINFLFSTN